MHTHPNRPPVLPIAGARSWHVSSGIRLRALTAGLTLLALSACTSLTTKPPAQVVAPEEAQAFELGGRINVRVANEGFPGRVHWRHEPALDELSFSSPIGTSVARLRQGPDGASLVTADGTQYQADDLRQLALDVLGWDLPLEALPYWVRGLAWPEAIAQFERGADGRLQSLQQTGWKVSYLGWDGAGVQGLPSKLDVAGERLRMRLVIERWTVQPAGGAADAFAAER